ncbi:MAG: hypothetical protein FD161_2234 [Limisphaerales bacterium]|nr:MAG: hypothetical protein FD161_2234 [Limisphaerales bacterium]KAG0508746.1 MAG: hypothetical protein E1N63_2036 [Limisphaerales bacterium]TXT50563.1 MAG: hypothetical protein FD140_2347 [Limisphaerales bacterium]
MNFPWVIQLASADAASLAGLRLSPGLEVAERAASLWLRSRNTDEALMRIVVCVPALARFEWLTNGGLRPVASRIPSATMPALEWQPLARWLSVTTLATAWPAAIPRPVPVKLVRSSAEAEPDLLLTDLEQWTRFARTAAEVRLRPLRFAVDANRRVLVQGGPLPALPGQRFVSHGPIAVPAGFTWEPGVSAEVLAKGWRVPLDALVLWHADGTLSRLHPEQFLPATRSALRATADAFAAS